MASLRVLNVPSTADSADADEKKSTQLSANDSVALSKTLQKLVKRVKGEYAMTDFVDYTALRSSDLYKEFQSLTLDLARVDLDAYNKQQSKAFFINVYNTLTIHGILAVDELPDSVLKVKKFWSTTCYKIGGHIFSLDDIEHGVLRGNRPHPASKEPCFKENDERLKYAAEKVDPRIHCALNCGAKSCPAISSYSEENLDNALDAATRNFCSQEVIVLPKNEEVYVSKIFEWYEKDFGENDVAAIQWTLGYLEPEKQSQLGILLQGILSVGKGRILYNEYDWSLNSTFR